MTPHTDTDWLDSVLDDLRIELVSIGSTHYHGDHKQCFKDQDDEVSRAKTAIANKLASEVLEAINKNNLDIVHGFDFKADDDVYSAGEIRKLKPTRTQLKASTTQST